MKHALNAITVVCGLFCMGSLVWSRTHPKEEARPDAGTRPPSAYVGAAKMDSEGNIGVELTARADGGCFAADDFQSRERDPKRCLTDGRFNTIDAIKNSLIAGGADNYLGRSNAAIVTGYHVIIGGQNPPNRPWEPDGVHPWPFEESICAACANHATNGLWLGGMRLALCDEHVAKLRKALR